MYLKQWLWQTILFAKMTLLILNPARASNLGASNDTTASNERPICGNVPYGQPRLDSCERAMEAIPDTTARILTFGIRPRAHLVSVVVPYRFMSRES